MLLKIKNKRIVKGTHIRNTNHTYLFVKIDIKVKMRTKELKDALKDGDITMERIISQAEKDAAAGLITATTFEDGGTKIYQYGTYTILKQNTLDGNKDVYIGPFGMQYEDVVEIEDEEVDTKKK